MQIKFYNLTTLESQIVNVKNGTFEETLNQAIKEVPGFSEITPTNQNGNTYAFPGFIADIIYYGVPASEITSRTRIDWEPKIKQFKAIYSPELTAKQLAEKTGIPLGQVYQIANKFLKKPMAKGQRGRRKRK